MNNTAILCLLSTRFYAVAPGSGNACTTACWDCVASAMPVGDRLALASRPVRHRSGGQPRRADARPGMGAWAALMSRAGGRRLRPRGLTVLPSRARDPHA
jgi:hypothetical protein